MRKSGARLHSDQEDCLSPNLDRGRIEDHVDSYWPVRRCQDRVLRMTPEELRRELGQTASTGSAALTTRGSPAASSSN